MGSEEYILSPWPNNIMGIYTLILITLAAVELHIQYTNEFTLIIVVAALTITLGSIIRSLVKIKGDQ